VLTILCAACGRNGPDGPQSIAVLRFDNLSGDASLDWMGRGMAEMLALQVRGAFTPIIPSRTVRIVHGRFTRPGGRLRVDVAVEDLGSRQRVANVSASGDSLLDVIGRVANQIDPSARPAPVRNDTALRYYAGALESGGAQPSVELLDRAIEADPDFGPAYVAAVSLAKARGDRAAAERYLRAASARGGALDERSRALLAHEAAGFKGDIEAQLKALAELARLNPADSSRWRALGLAESLAGKHSEAASHLRRALDLEPGDPQVLNELGYALGMAGDLEGGIKALREYERLRPKEGNPIDSMGDLHFYHRRFSDAAKLYLDAQERQPSFLGGAAFVKAAIAFYAAGQGARGDQAFGRFTQLQAANPELPLWSALWEAIRGRNGAAAKHLEPLAARNDELGARARGHLLVLALETGDRAAAERYARAVSPGVLGLLVSAEALGKLPDSGARDELLGFALMFAGKHADAAQSFLAARKRVVAMQRASLAMLAAWCQRQAGRSPDPDLLRYAPMPQVTSPNPLLAATYLRLSAVGS
jgi:tetratricopeptide (TPR) repeat protein